MTHAGACLSTPRQSHIFQVKTVVSSPPHPDCRESFVTHSEVKQESHHWKLSFTDVCTKSSRCRSDSLIRTTTVTRLNSTDSVSFDIFLESTAYQLLDQTLIKPKYVSLLCLPQLVHRRSYRAAVPAFNAICVHVVDAQCDAHGAAPHGSEYASDGYLQSSQPSTLSQGRNAL